MSNSKESFNKMVLLTGARIFGIIFSFAIPMFLGRHLGVEDYGTYKQVTLIYWFAQIALNLGFDDSVFYYLRQDRKNFPLYSFNALVFNLSATGLIATLMTIFRFEIAGLLNNPQLAQYLPILGFLIMMTMSSMQIEGFLLNLDRFRQRLFLDAGTELLKALAVLGAYWYFNSLFIALVLLSSLMTLRLLWSVLTMHQHKKQNGLQYREAKKYFFMQAKFGLPLGISRIVQNLLNLENLLISSLFNLTQFTYYAVGCFENPLINSMRTSLYELVNIDLIDSLKEKSYQKAVEAWRRMTRKLFLVVIPFTVFMVFFAQELIVFIFSEKYLPSVPFFMVFNLYIVMASLNPEPLFRASSQTSYALKIKTTGVLLGFLVMLIGAYVWGPMGVLWGKILAVGFVNFVGLAIGARLIESHWTKLFWWSEILKIACVSILAVILIRGMFFSGWAPPFWTLAAAFSCYFLIVLGLAVLTGILKQDEILHLKATLLKIVGKKL